jgi:hypothetical protein
VSQGGESLFVDVLVPGLARIALTTEIKAGERTVMSISSTRCFAGLTRASESHDERVEFQRPSFEGRLIADSEGGSCDAGSSVIQSV